MIDFKFPQDFFWGTAASAFQIEGAAHEDGKGQNVWDVASRQYPDIFAEDETPEVSADFYHRYPQDISMMKELGIKSFRFSISWTRIYPDGCGKLNQKGIDYYNKLIDTFLQNGIQPMLDLYHCDMPQALADKGGFKNPQFPEWFGEYARTCFENFGDRINLWNTINEPSVAAFSHYYTGQFPPFEKDLRGALQAAQNIILSHYKAIQIYRSMCLKGKIGIVMHFLPAYPASTEENDKKAAARSFDYYNNWWLQPFFEGKYPESVLAYPAFSENMPENYAIQLKEQFVPVDYIGINYYGPCAHRYKEGNDLDSEGVEFNAPKDAYGFTYYPQGLFDSAMYIKKRYNNPEIYITENGTARQSTGDVMKDTDDDYRISFMQEHFREIYRSIQAGARIKGYYHWSNTDTYECNCGGYQNRFGLVHIDFNTLIRTPKKSWFYYQKVIGDNSVI